MTKKKRGRRRVTVAMSVAVSAAQIGIATGPAAAAAAGIQTALSGGVLTITGTARDDTIHVGRGLSGAISLNGHTVSIKGVTQTVGTVHSITIIGGAGN